jgi:hypothetical protein
MIPQADPDTKSTEVRWPDAFFSSRFLRSCCWVLNSSSLNPHSGRSDIFHNSAGNDVSCCDCSSTPACSISFSNKLGFLRDDELASFELKCTLCFLIVRKCSKFALTAGFGDPGGDGGMSRLGTGGRVRSWMRAREAEKGDVRPLVEDLSSEGIMSIDAGPRTGPFASVVTVDGVISDSFPTGF